MQIQSLTMKASLLQANTHSKLHSSLPLHKTSQPLVLCQSSLHCHVKPPARASGFKVSHSCSNPVSCLVQKSRDNGLVVVGCANWGSVAELERELKAELNTEEGQEDRAEFGMARFRHKCGERKGILELLECLEREAIMGEDVGKEPADYNRRAQIFDRSSRVFQALKELNNDILSQQSSE